MGCAIGEAQTPELADQSHYEYLECGYRHRSADLAQLTESSEAPRHRSFDVHLQWQVCINVNAEIMNGPRVSGWDATVLQWLVVDAVPLMMFMVWLTDILVAVIPNPPEQLTTSLFMQDLICSQNDELCILIYVAPPIVVHFNYVKFAAWNLL